MPWKETCVMDEKVKLIADWLSEDYSITDLSEIYHVSRKTVYKWIDRYDIMGLDGLKDKTSAPLTRPRATPLDIISYILAAKSRHTKWGPRKLIAWLKNQYPEKKWPVASTAQTILKREGWVKTRHRRRHTPSYTEPFINSKAPNDVWCADFKGQFRMGEGRICYPLTISDSYSRYLLCCQGLYRPTYSGTKLHFEHVFREYGLPRAVRTDNGAPFASVALGGLSSLAVWLVKLGITPERIEPGKPEQNGRHERFHRTLKEATINPPRYSLAEQQRAFDRFRPEYNTERPHEAHGQKPPASVYQRSSREYPDKLPIIIYPDHYIVRQVRIGGPLKWKGDLVYVSKALVGEPLGLKQIDDQLWEVYFSFLLLGILDERLRKIIPL
jgi:transposase InsO family protein